MTKTVFITGAGRGIGLEFTKILLSQGHKVVATSRTLTPELKALPCETMGLDISSDLSDLKERAARLFPQGLDLLINNAGMLVQEDSFDKLDLNEVIKSFNVNAVGSMRVTQALLPALLKSNQAVVANVTSRMGSIDDNTSGKYYSYRMSKAALNMFNKSFSIDFPQITSVVLHPGWVQTRMGGASAPIQPADSAQSLLKIISGLTRKESGRFFDYDGKPIAW